MLPLATSMQRSTDWWIQKLSSWRWPRCLSLWCSITHGFHMLSFGGPMFLPMHIPVLVAGFLLPWQFAALVGITTPLLSSFLTGMPPVPTVFTMTAELFTYGITTSLLYRNFKKNTYVSMISAMLIGRLVSILANWILSTLFLGYHSS